VTRLQLQVQSARWRAHPLGKVVLLPVTLPVLLPVQAAGMVLHPPFLLPSL
jgi:hypothetical protein